jgi:hypothetical protein
MPLPRLDKEINDLVERIKFVGQSSHLLMLKRTYGSAVLWPKLFTLSIQLTLS